MNTQANPFLQESAVISQFPGFGPVRAHQLSGYLSIGDDAGGWLYFWFSEAASNPENAPLLVWINYAAEQNALACLFDGHGPYLLDESGCVHANPFSWHLHANYLIIDQPLGHGLSFLSHPRYQPANYEESSQQTYHALQEFLLRWPRYRQLDCYLFGVGQACHTQAHLAHRILDGNHGGQPEIRLRGLGLGNALIAPEIQLQSHIEFACQHRLIHAEEKRRAEALLQDFRQANASPSPLQRQRANQLAKELELYIEQCSGRDSQDIRLPPGRAHAQLGDYLAKPAARQALHIDPRALKPPPPFAAQQAAWQESSSHLFPRLMEKLKLLFFHGECSMQGNHHGMEAWLNTLCWSDAAVFRQQKRETWQPYGLPAGQFLRHNQLSHLIIHDAGLHIARTQPACALAMLQQYLTAAEVGEPQAR
ncbi:hypothetical protein JFK97_07940 [Chromobacterium phragmitis]|uniref:S10 family peptidase n=1 Tax=Chromobacterium amazonense TaxID=1382803 RepID=UPI0021B84AC4|nr:S10 family peptidase [Chromobacterium amazonense]MBM2884316.1 hypothetical protein [Chromobacterium amazonense]